MKKEKPGKKERKTMEIELPNGVNAAVNGQFLLIDGPKGEAKRETKQQNVSIETGDRKIILHSKKDTKKDRKNIGSMMAHIKNMIKGTLQNHVYILRICSGHFPMNVTTSGNKLVVKNFLGEKVPRVLQLKEGAEVRVENDYIYVTSLSKEITGQVSADIEQLTRRPGFDTRIFQDGIYVVNKDGKELK